MASLTSLYTPTPKFTKYEDLTDEQLTALLLTTTDPQGIAYLTKELNRRQQEKAKANASANTNTETDKFNANGELKNGETVTYQTKKGVTYFIRNEWGEYTVWKQVYVSGSGGGTGKWKDVFVKPTKEIKDKFKLEKT